MFSIDGSVTGEYVKNTIELWVGMLLHPVFLKGQSTKLNEHATGLIDASAALNMVYF
jgi:hypothetical protein